MSSVAAGYLQILLFLGIALALSGAFVVLPMIVSRFTGAHQPDPAKLAEYECGFPAFDDARAQFDVRYYQVAILFLVFDIEAAFMYPWAVLYNQLSRGPMGQVSFFGFAEMLIFVAILVVALAYVWRKKAIGWE